MLIGGPVSLSLCVNGVESFVVIKIPFILSASRPFSI